MLVQNIESLSGFKRERNDGKDDIIDTDCCSSLSSKSNWKNMYNTEKTTNTMLNLQLCFVQSECVRLLRLQSDMANNIATLQVDLLLF